MRSRTSTLSELGRLKESYHETEVGFCRVTGDERFGVAGMRENPPLVSTISDAPDQIVNIPDSSFEEVVREELGKPSGAITCFDMEKLTVLSPMLYYGNIVSFEGLQYAKNLEQLEVDGDEISDLTPLAGLTKLAVLWLGRNEKLSDLTPLAGLKNLTQFELYLSQVSDLTPLAGLTNLRKLGLDRNKISDLTPLDGLTDLKFL